MQHRLQSTIFVYQVFVYTLSLNESNCNKANDKVQCEIVVVIIFVRRFLVILDLVPLLNSFQVLRQVNLLSTRVTVVVFRILIILEQGVLWALPNIVLGSMVIVPVWLVVYLFRPPRG